MKKVLFICDDVQHFKLSVDTTILFFLTADDLGFELYLTNPKDLSLEDNAVYAYIYKVKLNQKIDQIDQLKPGWIDYTNIKRANINRFDAVFVRNDPPFDMEYYYLTQLLSIAQDKGCKVVNDSYILRNINEKLSIFNFPQFIPNTLVTKNKKDIFNFVKRNNECVIKPLDLMGGRSVFKISLSDVNLDVIIESITNFYTQTVMVQEFIPDVVKGDKRIFIINGEVLDVCLYRIPKDNQIRGNLASGGIGEVRNLGESDMRIANEVGEWCKNKGLVFVGIDILGSKLTEINITSPTGARQIFNYNKTNIAKMVFDAVFNGSVASVPLE